MGMGWMTEQDQGFVMKHSVSNHAYPYHLEKRQADSRLFIFNITDH